MSMTYGTREIVRNPSLLRIEPKDSFIIEDKKSHKQLGVYLGSKLAEEFFKYTRKQELLASANKIKENAIDENNALEGTLSDEL